jgi:hypothetical protein
MYSLILAKAHRKLGQPLAAITTLEQAIERGKPPAKHSTAASTNSILRFWKNCDRFILEQQDYLRAFELKQERRSIEHKNMDFVPSSALPPCSPWLGKVRHFAIRLWNRCRWTFAGC